MYPRISSSRTSSRSGARRTAACRHQSTHRISRNRKHLGRHNQRHHQAAIHWLQNELAPALGCLVCTFCGVQLTAALPWMLALWHQPLLPFGAALTPLAGLAIAIRVFDVRSYTRWQSGRAAPLGVRMVRACSDGMSWPLWWRIRVVVLLEATVSTASDSNAVGSSRDPAASGGADWGVAATHGCLVSKRWFV